MSTVNENSFFFMLLQYCNSITRKPGSMWHMSVRIRDRPFNLKGGGGGYGFLFRSEFCFRTTQELEYLFFLSRGAQIFFQEFNSRLYDKNSESDYFFFLHQNQNIFFSNIGNQNIFLEKNHNPPFKLNGRSLIQSRKKNIVLKCTCRLRLTLINHFEIKVRIMCRLLYILKSSSTLSKYYSGHVRLGKSVL